jgi:molybdopterin synthase catalytic subunit
MIEIRVSTEDFDAAQWLARLEALGGGAVASFTGIVRGGGGLTLLQLDHYPAMTQMQIGRIVAEAHARWSLLGVAVIHRVGMLKPGNRIVFVGTASSHRAAALDSCAYLIDWLKTSAPFWKKESFEDGRESWVEERHEDNVALERWR